MWKKTWTPEVGEWIVRRTECIGNLAGLEFLPLLADSRRLSAGDA